MPSDYCAAINENIFINSATTTVLTTDSDIDIFAKIHHHIQALVKQRRKVFVEACNELWCKPFLVATTTGSTHYQLESIDMLQYT